MEALFNNGRVRRQFAIYCRHPLCWRSPTDANGKPTDHPDYRFSLGLFREQHYERSLSAAEAEGNVKIISRPSVVTLNNVVND